MESDASEAEKLPAIGHRIRPQRMTDRPSSGTPQGPARVAQATSPRDAGTLSTPEISAPMLDVHAPHQTVHTWKDFLVHIAAITIGLLMALGLEAAVAWFHHRHQRHLLQRL